MSTITVQEIQLDPQDFLRRLEAGEPLLVMSGGHAVAQVQPVGLAQAQAPRPFGLCAGQFKVPADFDAPLPDEVLDEFEGR